MITKHNIIKMVRHIVRRGDGYPDHRIMHPARDWSVGLLGVAVLFLGTSVGAGYLFWRIDNTATEAYTVTIDPVTYDQKLIKRVLTDYAATRARYKSLRGDTISVPAAASTGATSTDRVREDHAPPVAEEGLLQVE